MNTWQIRALHKLLLRFYSQHVMQPNYSSLIHAFEAPLKVHQVFLRESFCQCPNKAQFCPFWLIIFTATVRNQAWNYSVNMAITTPERWKQIRKTSYPTFFIHRLQTPWMVSGAVLVSTRPFRSKQHIWPCWQKMSLGSHWSTSLLCLNNNLHNRYYTSYLIVLSELHIKVESKSDMK